MDIRYFYKNFKHEVTKVRENEEKMEEMECIDTEDKMEEFKDK